MLNLGSTQKWANSVVTKSGQGWVGPNELLLTPTQSEKIEKRKKKEEEDIVSLVLMKNILINCFIKFHPNYIRTY